MLVGLTAVASPRLRADATQQSEIAEIQFQLANELFAEGRYGEALDAYQRAVTASGPDDVRRPRAGLIISALRLAEFDLARAQAEESRKTQIALWIGAIALAILALSQVF